MGLVPFAVSIHNFIHSVGADCGFAAIIGLAILALLYFAGARETTTQRERLEAAHDRVANLEARLLALQRSAAREVPSGSEPTQPPVAPRPPTSSRAVAVPVAAAGITASRVTAGAAVSTPFLGAPVNTGAPALAAATKLIPVGAPVAAPAAAVIDSPEIATASENTLFASPATVAGGANGNGTAPVAPPPRLPARGAPVATRASSAPPRVALTTSEGTPPPRRTAPLPTQRGSDEGPLRRAAPILLGLGAVALVVIVLLLVTGGGSKTTPVHHSAAVRTSTHRPTVAFSPERTTVSVLNGTAVYHVAHMVGETLSSGGYKVPTSLITNAASQTDANSTVGYLPGYKEAAQRIAKRLGLSQSAVGPASGSAIKVACPGTSTGASATSTGACSADVIVTVGSDLATSTSTSGTSGATGATGTT